MEHTILYGNGLNMLGTKKVSWNNLLIDLSKLSGYELTIGNKPYTMVYEELLLGGSLSETDIKNDIISKLKESIPNEFYKIMRDLNLKNYLTTNYEFNLESSFREINCSYKNNKLEDIYSIRTCLDVESNNSSKSKVWHLHGDIDRAKSISLGLNHYCGTIGKMDGYFKGTYEYTLNGKKVKLDALSKKLRREVQHDGISWIELFFTTNIHIVGLSLDYSETDLWWLLNRRARPLNFNTNDIKNEIIYYDTEINETKASDKKQLLEAFNVKYIHIPVDNGKWDEAYMRIFEMIEHSKISK